MNRSSRDLPYESEATTEEPFLVIIILTRRFRGRNRKNLELRFDVSVGGLLSVILRDFTVYKLNKSIHSCTCTRKKEKIALLSVDGGDYLESEYDIELWLR